MQVPMEAAGSVMVLCAVVPRDRCVGGCGLEALRNLVPQASPLLDAKDLEVQVKVVGERAPLRRVPAHGERKVLPPQMWERGFLPMDRVLVCLVVRKASGPWRELSVVAVRGDLPVPPDDGLEILRLEYLLPPATRQAVAEKAMWSAVRKVAQEMQLPMPLGPQMV